MADPHASAAMATTGADPARARLGLILLHGRGGSAADILGLGAHLGFDDIAMIAPEAEGNSWWPVSFLAQTRSIAQWRDSALDTVDRALRTMSSAGLPRERIVVAGFSQGACLALEFVARTGGPLHSVFSLSGALLGTSDTGTPSPDFYGHADKRFDYTACLDGVPVFLSCHARDPHIPLRRVEQSAEVFRTLGARVRTEIYPGPGHGVMQGDIDAMRAALEN